MRKLSVQNQDLVQFRHRQARAGDGGMLSAANQPLLGNGGDERALSGEKVPETEGSGACGAGTFDAEQQPFVNAEGADRENKRVI